MHQPHAIQLMLLQESEPQPLPVELREELVTALTELLVAEAAREVDADER